MNLQNPKKLIKNIGIGIAFLGVLALIYYFFTNNYSATPSTTTAENSIANNSDQIANTLTQLNGLRQGILDSRDILENNHGFKSLNDFSVTISAEPYGGRENPFAETPEKIKRDAEANKPSTPTAQDTSSSTLGTN